MTKKVTTTKNIKKNAKTTTAELDKQITDAAKILKDEKKVKVMIPKILEKRLGANVPVGVNGAVIHVPVGKEVEIPESMAEVLNASINSIR